MRRAIFIILSAAMLAMTAQAQQPSPAREVRVRKGMLLKLELLQPLDPATASPGDDVSLGLMRPLYVEGVTLIPEGALLHGVVTKVKRVSNRCRTGEVSWKLERITFADGSTVRTRIWMKNPRPNSRVAQEVPKEVPTATERFDQAVLLPYIAVGTVELGIVKLVAKPFLIGVCSRFTRDFPLPAHSTVAMEIVEDHTVRY